MVVEDEPIVLRVTCQYLEEAGFECIPAASADAAAAHLEAGRIPDLLLMDIRLPDVPGPELALRIHGRYPRVPVLFVSGWVDGLSNPAKLEALQWGFLPKPFTGESLVEAVRQMLAPVKTPA
jgi:two-component system C4-dicarboxylate transport response regulator DctD